MFSVVSVCLSMEGGLHVTIIHDSIGQLQVLQAPPTPTPPDHTKTTSPWSPYYIRNPQNVQTCSLGPHCTDTHPYGVFTMPDTETDTDTNEKLVV